MSLYEKYFFIELNIRVIMVAATVMIHSVFFLSIIVLVSCFYQMLNNICSTGSLTNERSHSMRNLMHTFRHKLSVWKTDISKRLIGFKDTSS